MEQKKIDRINALAEGSPGWIVPAKPGLYIARGVAQSVQLEITQAMQSRLGV